MKSSILDEVKTAAQGQWLSRIYPALGIAVPNGGRHGPDPFCGGKDRFRCDDKDGHGTWFCNQCVPRSGDGFGLVGKCLNLRFSETLQRVGELVGVPFTTQQTQSHHRPVYRPVNLAALTIQSAHSLKESANELLDHADRRYAHAKMILDAAQGVSIERWTNSELHNTLGVVALAHREILLCDKLQDLSFELHQSALDLEHNRER